MKHVSTGSAALLSGLLLFCLVHAERPAAQDWAAITAQLKGPMNVEDLIRVAEQAASCELWGLLKRPDEKYVTERAYDNPKFVEDLVRNVALRLNAHPDVTWFKVEAENYESIHNHNAYACIEKD